MLLVAGNMFAQATSKMTTAAWRDTLNATTRDTLTIELPIGYRSYTITAETTTGADTVYVDTKTKKSPAGYEAWSQKALINMQTTAYAESIIVTTTPTEYWIYDSQVIQIRLRTTDASVTTRFIVVGKN